MGRQRNVLGVVEEIGQMPICHFPSSRTEAVCMRTFLTIRAKTNYELICKRTGTIRF